MRPVEPASARHTYMELSRLISVEFWNTAHVVFIVYVQQRGTGGKGSVTVEVIVSTVSYRVFHYGGRGEIGAPLT